jgi:SAM-dependent methyltransferase
VTTAAFDPIMYKTSTRDQWEQAAAAWDHWDPTLEAWLGPATELMLDLCRMGAGGNVLDVAAGSGGQTAAAARRVGPDGHVLATDISPAILAYAARRTAGFGTVTVAVQDGEELSVPSEHFDAVISRLGLIYFPDQRRALAGMRAALRPGGRIGAIVYGPADANGFFSVPIGIIRRRAKLPPPAPGQPGPFSLSGPGVLAETLAGAGITDVEVHAVDAPLQMASSADCLRFAQESFGALHQMLIGLDPQERREAWDEVGAALAEFDGPDGFVGPCQLLVAAGTRLAFPQLTRRT